MVEDRFQLQRFVRAQEGIYEQALAGLRAGRKRTHWMWFIFPQIRGLGSSSTAQEFAISGRPEAEAYLGHPVLGGRFGECTRAVLGTQGRSVGQIFGYPDDLKFRSSLTLFARVAPEGESVFCEALELCFDGVEDEATVSRL